MNPHFLFNMLNSIKSLVRTDSEKATQVIMKLSELLRYQLYESNDQKALLKSEINFLSNFLDLETLRRDNFSTDIKLNAHGRSINSIFLPPNLFTTFVENAVKHSVDTISGASFVRVEIEVNADRLYFVCVNSKDPNYRPSKMFKSNGLGLANITRRLELLYGHSHLLEIESAVNKYEVKLTIPL
ncbi:sensor histidine kinase [Flavobacterium sp. FlaQc-48]|uniref:sensor histidine kinase n=1 Tax=Flavobacterium sp. FlaQc-48 TaxID=3374181 RepID=UPI0037573861